MSNLIADWYRALGPDMPGAEWDEDAQAYRVPEAQEAEAA